MFKYLIILPLLINISYASEFKLIELDEIRIDYISFFDGGRDPMITNNGLPNRQLGKLLDLNVNTTVMKYGYFRGLVHSYTDAYRDSGNNGQFRSVGLNLEAGIRVLPSIDIFAYHYSQHLLDTPSSNIGGYPVSDGIGIHIYLYSNQRKESVINLK